MYSFIKDIKFMEQLKKQGFDETCCLTMVEDKLFFSGNRRDGIYQYFRANQPIAGNIAKPTGAGNEAITIEGNYSVVWEQLGSQFYYIMNIM
ncbi:MAG: hypothetical protein ACK5L3_03415, partial [Oscillospiraceae bacterium]